MAEDPICNVEVDEQTTQFKSQYESRHTTFAQNVRNNLNLGPNCKRASRKSAM